MCGTVECDVDIISVDASLPYTCSTSMCVLSALFWGIQDYKARIMSGLLDYNLFDPGFKGQYFPLRKMV